ncbi:hypothetical protein JTE90_018574 [Oedothorax gibbosus]|uniref:Uncharacterized protein n=1 Tax=Oedothorax gibbosus TaxID=931172 RepID=A0AAV6U457_9ARAC|nr:hypothetical protein JTE90_018574 [Oedothorax gibbosus]
MQQFIPKEFPNKVRKVQKPRTLSNHFQVPDQSPAEAAPTPLNFHPFRRGEEGGGGEVSPPPPLWIRAPLLKVYFPQKLILRFIPASQLTLPSIPLRPGNSDVLHKPLPPLRCETLLSPIAHRLADADCL